MACHNYSPDIMAMGDCKNCGHVYESHISNTHFSNLAQLSAKAHDHEELVERTARATGRKGVTSLMVRTQQALHARMAAETAARRAISEATG